MKTLNPVGNIAFVIYSGREEYIRAFVTKEEKFSLRNWSLCGSTYKGELGVVKNVTFKIRKKNSKTKKRKNIQPHQSLTLTRTFCYSDIQPL